jgi:hypothetical protein
MMKSNDLIFRFFSDHNKHGPMAGCNSIFKQNPNSVIKLFVHHLWKAEREIIFPSKNVNVRPYLRSMGISK